ncbi:MAG: hypothetical protein M3300_02645, partial [Actinomycetota bacterium]|nr:hypothetical protein [Actinomycetota bacterium]
RLRQSVPKPRRCPALWLPPAANGFAATHRHLKRCPPMVPNIQLRRHNQGIPLGQVPVAPRRPRWPRSVRYWTLPPGE